MNVGMGILCLIWGFNFVIMKFMNVRLGGSVWIVLLALSSAVSWAIANLLFKLKLKHCDTVQFTTWQMTIGAVGLLI